MEPIRETLSSRQEEISARIRTHQRGGAVLIQWVISEEAKQMALSAATAAGFSKNPGAWLDELIKKHSPRVMLIPSAAEQTAA
jgi:hypothetical protein